MAVVDVKERRSHLNLYTCAHNLHVNIKEQTISESGRPFKVSLKVVANTVVLRSDWKGDRDAISHYEKMLWFDLQYRLQES